jgi:large subunit ribosomal protein L24
MTLRIRKDDTVQVLSGKDRGKTGRVLKVFPHKERVIVEGINLVKRHTRPNPKNQQGGILAKESSLHISNVALYCSRCRKGVRFGVRILDDGSKIRFCRKCKEAF